MKVSIITFCKARLDHLKQMLPTAFGQTHPDIEVVVVDYKCPEGTAQFVRENYPQAVVVEVDAPEKEWNINKARNAGIRASSGEVVLIADCDTIFEPACIENNLKVLEQFDFLSFRGNVMISREKVLALKGYNELHVHGYGHDDGDFYNRAMRIGKLRGNTMKHMSCVIHEDGLRFRYQDLPVRISAYRNKMVRDFQGL
jgi:glycosyltransferase involved in cell wall biosynthesis